MLLYNTDTWQENIHTSTTNLDDSNTTVTGARTTPKTSTMNQPRLTNISESSVFIQQLQDKKRQLQNQIDEIEEKKDWN